MPYSRLLILISLQLIIDKKTIVSKKKCTWTNTRKIFWVNDERIVKFNWRKKIKYWNGHLIATTKTFTIFNDQKLNQQVGGTSVVFMCKNGLFFSWASNLIESSKRMCHQVDINKKKPESEMKHEVKLFMSTTSDCPISLPHFSNLFACEKKKMGTKASDERKQVATRNFLNRKHIINISTP